MDEITKIEAESRHPGGRPIKFPSVEALEEAANKYFEATPLMMWTVTGLALALDTSRETLCNYEKRDEFFDIVKKLKLKVEHAYELRGMEKGTSFDIFRLKVMGWPDKQLIEEKSERTIEIKWNNADNNTIHTEAVTE